MSNIKYERHVDEHEDSSHSPGAVHQGLQLIPIHKNQSSTAAMSLNNDYVKLPVSDDKLDALVKFSNTWSMANGILVGASEHDAATYAPHTLLPSPYPRSQFEKALAVQTGFNELFWKVAMDDEFLTASLESTIPVDEFTARLFRIYKQVRKEGHVKPITLALLRSDYLLDSETENGPEIRQVEINTIASGAAGNSTRLTKLHRATLADQDIAFKSSDLPGNSCLDGLSEGLIKAWELYERPGSVLLFLVADGEKNIFDISYHIYKITELNPGAKVIIRSLPYVGEHAQLTEDRRLKVDGEEVAVLYYRIGYMPAHFISEKEWNFKLIAEQSMAAVCPSIDWHLAGTKKVQQELSRPGVLEKFLSDPDMIANIRSTFAGQYPLELTDEGNQAAAMAISSPRKFVMKPQREGGGNNIYGDDIASKLQELEGQEERAAYILMERIVPMLVKNYELRRGITVAMHDMVSELGIFGVLVCKEDKAVINKKSGHLLRTKNILKDEGGIRGASALDSPYLV